MENCEYCHPEIRNDQRVVLSNEHGLFLQLMEPEIEGAGVIVPRCHRETVFDFTDSAN